MHLHTQKKEGKGGGVSKKCLKDWVKRSKGESSYAGEGPITETDINEIVLLLT
jgi:hypothetical protein